jgi:hypothetical protein
MTSTVSADFAALQLALPELAPGDDLVLREDDGKACALLGFGQEFSWIVANGFEFQVSHAAPP